MGSLKCQLIQYFVRKFSGLIQKIVYCLVMSRFFTNFVDRWIRNLSRMAWIQGNGCFYSWSWRWYLSEGSTVKM